MNAHEKPRPPLAPGMICTDTRDGSTVRLVEPVSLCYWRAAVLMPDGGWSPGHPVIHEQHIEPLDEPLPGDDKDEVACSASYDGKVVEVKKTRFSADDFGDVPAPDDPGPIGILYRALADLDDERAELKGAVRRAKESKARAHDSLREVAAKRREIVAAIQKLAEA